MATVVGQFVYNLIDYKHQNAPFSSTQNQIFAAGSATSTNILPANTKVRKLGIQAPPGTHFEIGVDGSNPYNIVIGRSGIYEVEEDNISIASLKILRQPIFQKNTAQTTQKLYEGAQAMAAAWKKLKDRIGEEISEPENSQYWENFVDANEEYKKDYGLAYSDYQKGISGIYEAALDGSGQPLYQDIYNIVVDYIYES